MRLTFDDEALAEIEESRLYYYGVSRKLALRFLDEVQRGLDKIRESPQMWPPHTRNTRRYFLKTFPHHLIYRTTTDGITIIAVAHAKRDPKYWLKRLDNQ